MSNDTDRRWELIAKEIFGNLTQEERKELDKLNEAIPKNQAYTKSKFITEEQYDTVVL